MMLPIISASIKFFSFIYKGIGKWLQNIFNTIPTTKITKEVTSYFELLEKLLAEGGPENVRYSGKQHGITRVPRTDSSGKETL